MTDQPPSPIPNRPGFQFSVGFLLVTVAVIGVLIVVFVLGPLHFMEGHPVSLRSLGRVQVGMSGEEVTQLLGRSDSIANSPSGVQWTYRGWTWCVVRINFDDKGKVTEIDHDH